MENTVTWLHLSDLHMCSEKTGWDADDVLDKLADDLRFLDKAHGLTPDLVFFTGDLAFGHDPRSGWLLPEQYREVEAFLSGLRHCIPGKTIPKDRVFLVPGNHDVDRTVVDRKLTRTIERLETLEQTKDFLRGARWTEVAQRFEAYRHFLSSNGYDHLLQGPDHQHLIYGSIVDVRGIHVGIGGLNSAWSCQGDEKRGALRVGGRWQARRVASLIRDADFRIGLMHHPFEWLHGGEATPTTETIEQSFEFFLHGHEHYMQIKPQDNGHHRIASGACYQHSRNENAYNIVRFDVKRGTAAVWLRRYDPSGGGWVPRPYYKGTNDRGVWNLKKSVRELAVRIRARVGVPASRRVPPPELSAAVCYKKDATGEVKFLLVQTDEERPIFPKRTILRGLTAKAVAIRVAAIEGGVEGIARGELGSRYEYTNADGTQTMAAFLVEHRLTVKPERAWRKPQWFSYDDARHELTKKREPAHAAQLIKILDDAWQKLTC